jgi:hypothetical protein
MPGKCRWDGILVRWRPRRFQLARQLTLFDRAIHLRQDDLEVERFRDVIEGPEFHGVDGGALSPCAVITIRAVSDPPSRDAAP